MDINDFFKIFIGFLLIICAIFAFMYTGHEFECTLPNGGYLKIRWKQDSKKFDVLHWQPKNKAKPLPKNSIFLQGEKQEKEVKPHF